MDPRLVGNVMKYRAWLIVIVIVALVGFPATAINQTPKSVSQPPAVDWTGKPGPQGTEEGHLRRQFWQVPSPVVGQMPLKATVYRPLGDGPFPLAVVSHGGTTDAAQRRKLSLPHMLAVSEWLVVRGFAVIVPQRRNYGDDPNPFAEDHGPCASPDFRNAGLSTADDIRAAADFMKAQGFVDAKRVLLVGHSAGGFGSLALAATGYVGVIGVINFGGGKGAFPKGDWRQNCAPQLLIKTMKIFGSTTKVPSLWIYAENDKFFSPDFVRMMQEAYDAKRGISTLIITPPFGDDGHRMVNWPNARATWTDAAVTFLDQLK
jgi:dienelactone hydrolase